MNWVPIWMFVPHWRLTRNIWIMWQLVLPLGLHSDSRWSLPEATTEVDKNTCDGSWKKLVYHTKLVWIPHCQATKALGRVLHRFCPSPCDPGQQEVSDTRTCKQSITPRSTSPSFYLVSTLQGLKAGGWRSGGLGMECSTRVETSGSDSVLLESSPTLP